MISEWTEWDDRWAEPSDHHILYMPYNKAVLDVSPDLDLHS